MVDSESNSLEASAQTNAVDAEVTINKSRRRLTGAGVGVSAIFTLASRPVLAANCLSASAAASGNMSHHGTAPICTGKTASFWADNCTVKDKFHKTFAKGTFADWGSMKLRQVLRAADNVNGKPHPNPISKEFVAALLNIGEGHIPATVLTDVKLIGMWNEWVHNGVFSPSAGASWDATQIVTYLRGLQS